MIYAGYMVLEPKIFNYIEGDDSVLETDTLEKLVTEGELMSYVYRGFWQCMDKIREKNILEEMWRKLMEDNCDSLGSE